MVIAYSTIRQRLESREDSLSPFSARSKESRGRLKPESSCPMRTIFQQDRDRIVHCKAFRRLKHKTQVFIAPLGDHYVTRLTHTIEVSQIARTIARALNLNEDLTESIALGHDLGHTPFGHIGEQVIDNLSPFGFRHSQQSLRVVDHLERSGAGLNLTWEVRDGILNHSKSAGDIQGNESVQPATLEGQVCRIADGIAYINHDIDDAIRSGFIAASNLPYSATEVLGYTHSERINTMVQDVVEFSAAQDRTISLSDPVRNAANLLREFLFCNVYLPSSATRESIRARDVILTLYEYFITHFDCLSSEYTNHANNTEQGAIDYIAGMTDRFALRTAIRINPRLQTIPSTYSHIGLL